jgi:hypothetical protein
MANVTVKKVEENKLVAAPVLEEMRATFDKIRKRAFEFFEWRGERSGFEVDDWVRRRARSVLGTAGRIARDRT